MSPNWASPKQCMNMRYTSYSPLQKDGQLGEIFSLNSSPINNCCSRDRFASLRLRISGQPMPGHHTRPGQQQLCRSLLLPSARETSISEVMFSTLSHYRGYRRCQGRQRLWFLGRVLYGPCSPRDPECICCVPWPHQSCCDCDAARDDATCHWRTQSHTGALPGGPALCVET